MQLISAIAIGERLRKIHSGIKTYTIARFLLRDENFFPILLKCGRTL